MKRDVTLVWGYTDKKDGRWKEGKNNCSDGDNDCLIHVGYSCDG